MQLLDHMYKAGKDALYGGRVCPSVCAPESALKFFGQIVIRYVEIFTKLCWIITAFSHVDAQCNPFYLRQ
jgi:hypothetical protein